MASILKNDSPTESFDWSPFPSATMPVDRACQDDTPSNPSNPSRNDARDFDASARLADREREIELACEQRLRETVEQQVRVESEQARQALAALTLQVDAAHQQWHAAAEERIVHIALAVANRVLRGEVQDRPEIPLRLVREAIDLAGSRGPMRVVLHPEDHQLLLDEVQQSVDTLQRQGPVDIVADPTVSRGGCRVDTAQGTIDQTIESQLERIREELTDGR